MKKTIFFLMVLGLSMTTFAAEECYKDSTTSFYASDSTLACTTSHTVNPEQGFRVNNEYYFKGEEPYLNKTDTFWFDESGRDIREVCDYISYSYECLYSFQDNKEIIHIFLEGELVGLNICYRNENGLDTLNIRYILPDTINPVYYIRTSWTASGKKARLLNYEPDSTGQFQVEQEEIYTYDEEDRLIEMLIKIAGAINWKTVSSYDERGLERYLDDYIWSNKLQDFKHYTHTINHYTCDPTALEPAPVLLRQMPSFKTIRDGRLLILREGKKFNALGGVMQ